MRTGLARQWIAGSTALWLAGCGGPQQVSVDHVWVRLSAIKTNPAAAYFTIHGGPQDRTLVAVSADAAVKAEMHETMTTGHRMSTMASIAAVRVPARTEVGFKPGGRHVMLFDVNRAIKPGSALTLTFTFANSERIIERADVIAAGDPAPQ